MTQAVFTLDKFECEGDIGSVAVRWERWKRGLYIYLEAAGIDTEAKKRACLLHFGGADLQEVFYNIPGADAEPDDENGGKVFEIAIKKLDEYFAPKQSKGFERHLFRLMRQEPQEKFDKFLIRLRHQASKCQFTNTDEHIIEQITEKCSSDDLRKKILKNGDKMTLDDIISEANVLEVVERQLGDFESKKIENHSVNKITTKPDKYKGTGDRQDRGCGRCGSMKHFARDPKCPARTRKCNKCGIVGHFQIRCRTREVQKRKLEQDEAARNNNSKRARGANNVEEAANVGCTSRQIDYIFNVNIGPTASCMIGGTKVDMLIDSGCNHNLITDKTWLSMKENNSKVSNQSKDPQKKFVAYGSGTPLKLLGSFEAEIRLGKKSEIATFYVISGGTQNLLGKVTATSLGVLQINIPTDVNNVETTTFPKFKDVLVEIPMDESVKPVAQPYRRIPIPLEAKVEQKIDELLQADIIEEVKGPSSWVSPIVPVLKDDGDVRLCVDMRRANMAIKRENHPLPTMDQLLPKMREAKLFTKLDIKDAFHHIELHPDSRPITTFITDCKLSTNPPQVGVDYVQNVIEQVRPTAIPLQDIMAHSRQDAEIQAVKNGLYNNQWSDLTKGYKLFQDELCFYEDILLRGTKIVMPQKLRDPILRIAHEGHPGICAMKTRLRTKVWWPKCDKDAENFCKSCKGCVLVSTPNPPNPIKRRELPSEPWVDTAVDLMGPLPSNDYIFVIVDYYSRYKEVKVCRTITSSEIINQLKDIFSRLGNPVSITADNGRQFTSEDFKLFCSERNIKLHNTIPYWPQQNGEVERQNRDILKRLKIAQAEKKNWKESLREYMVMYNSTPHSVTGKTPSELFFRRQFRDKLPMIQDMTYSSEDLEMKDRDKELKEKGKEYADRKRRAADSELNIGEKVYVKNMHKNNKLSLNYEPTSHTVESNKNGDVELRNDNTGQVVRRNILHLKRVEGLWKVANETEDIDGDDSSRNETDSD
uniref:RNA-directed DNA polymerase n=1 Tax=Spodoptera frugiperda TaxID=7108 RepID=A0A2H1X000_SPOFR